MATWTNIANTSLEPGSPARSVDAFALRDNPIAIAQGAAGAPRIQTAAIQDSAVTAAKLATGGGERNWVLARTAGAGAQAVGSYCFGLRSATNSNNQISQGSTYAASSVEGLSSGTWRAMGAGIFQFSGGTTTVWGQIFLRIS